MINLAGRKGADEHIEEELYLAGINLRRKKVVSIDGHHWATYKDGERSEVPYSIYGVLGGWIFKRAWYYYMASCPDGLGLPYSTAIELHERKYPIKSTKYSILGQSVRVDGSCACPHPKECRYSTLEGLEEELIEARKTFPELDLNAKRAFGGSWLRELGGVKYIRLYHIDTQIGLKELASTINSL